MNRARRRLQASTLTRCWWGGQAFSGDTPHGEAMAATIAFLVRRGVPVMGHVGLTPQSVNALGGYRSQGHDAESAERIAADAHAIAEAGAFSLVIEFRRRR